MVDLTKLTDRVKIIKEINSTENKGRKYESLRQTEIYNDRIFDHVYERLIRYNNERTVLEMPIISSINLARRIVKKEASIYKHEPKREFSNLTDQQYEVVEKIYRDLQINSKLLQSNESFKLQNQNHIMIVPKNGKLIMRVLKNHHLDSVDTEDDPEVASAYIISQVDKNEVRRNRSVNRGGTGVRRQYDSWTDQEGNFTNESIGDDDDFQLQLKKYVVWSPEYNFIMNGKGEILSEEIENVSGICPIVDVAIEKDFEYWVRQGDSVTEFTIEYNSMLSDVSQVVRMQGYAQSYLIAKDDLIPEAVQTGPNFLLKLPVEEGSSVRPEFGFSNPGADLQGSISFIESTLATFLTSRGLDPTTVSGSGQVNKPTSGIDRLLMMIDAFEASKSDFDTYQMVEKKIYKIIKAWHNASLGTDLLNPEYQTSALPDESEVFVEFAGPEMVKSEMDRVELWERRIGLGEATILDMIQDMRGVDRDQAEEILQENETIGGFNGIRVSQQPGNENINTQS